MKLFKQRFEIDFLPEFKPLQQSPFHCDKIVVFTLHFTMKLHVEHSQSISDILCYVYELHESESVSRCSIVQQGQQ